jgi:hypothetical protein
MEYVVGKVGIEKYQDECPRQPIPIMRELTQEIEYDTRYYE